MKLDNEKIVEVQSYDQIDHLYFKLANLILNYHPSTDISQIHKAYEIAKKSHTGQKRKSGEPYIIHPLEVSIILAELKLDKETIIAGLLHDVVEDTILTNEDIIAIFGNEIAFLVDGVTKLEKLPYKYEKDEILAENYRKLFLAMAEDIRVILIKIADRLHNMRTLTFQPRHKQIEIAQETLDIYAPLANRLGICCIKSELEDLCLKYINTEMYNFISAKVEALYEGKKDFINDNVININHILESNKFPAIVKDCPKHIFSIYKKIIRDDKKYDFYDCYHILIIVDDAIECYKTLGLLHNEYESVKGHFKDYIAVPKINKYQSLHTTLLSKHGEMFELQIRTKEMEQIAQYGITYQWNYQESNDEMTNKKHEERFHWLNKIIEWQKEIVDNRDYLSIIRDDLNLFSEKIFCLTPKGEIKYLTKGSSIIDFAYLIHSDIGNHMIGATINGVAAELNYKIQSGDCINIITSMNAPGPVPEWLNYVITPQAKSSISKFLKNKYHIEYLENGKNKMHKYCLMSKIDLEQYMVPDNLNNLYAKYNVNSWEAILVAIGFGSMTAGQVVNKLQALSGKVETNTKGSDVVRKVKLAKCCKPVYGDEIVGVKYSKKISVHRYNCKNLLDLDKKIATIVNLDWEKDLGFLKGHLFLVGIDIIVVDSVGILNQIVEVLNRMDIQLISLETKDVSISAEEKKIKINLCINTKKRLDELIERLNLNNHIVSVERI